MTTPAVAPASRSRSTTIPWARAPAGLVVLTVGASQTPYGTAGVFGVLVSLIGPALLVLGGKGWPHWDNRALLWGYWLAFFPAAALATAMLRPRG